MLVLVLMVCSLVVRLVGRCLVMVWLVILFSVCLCDYFISSGYFSLVRCCCLVSRCRLCVEFFVKL